MVTKVYPVSLGCPKNTVDTEKMLATLALEGVVICGDIEDADVAIVASCSFIEPARNETLSVIEEMLTAKEAGKINAVVLAGCMVEHFGDALLEMLPGVDAFVGFAGYSDMAKIVRRATEGERGILEKPTLPGTLGYEGERLRITPPHYAYLRVSEGCDNRCAYCKIPDIRGRLRSKPVDKVMAEAMELAEAGARELVLVAEDTTAWGRDLSEKHGFSTLLRHLETVDGVEWIRIMYAYPSHVSDELIEIAGSGGKVLPYLDLPIQHASTRILGAMGRSYTREDLDRLLEKLKNRVESLVLRTSVITGFPGETDEDFKEVLGLVESGIFQRVGCFIYSNEPGTRAHDHGKQVDEETAIRRQERIMNASKNALVKFHRSLIGKEVPVIVEGLVEHKKYAMVGRSWADAPEIDANILFLKGRKAEPGTVTKALVKGDRGYDVVGSLS